MKRAYLAIFVFMVTFLAGCALMDSATGYNPVTGEVAPDAPINTAIEVAEGFGPWGSVIAGAIGLAAGGYVLVRKIQKKLK
jgi:hypothetical protein